MMAPDDYDLAGFTVGIVDKKKIVDGSRLQAGDVLLGVKSSGVHSNGFSLVRKVFGIGAMDMPNVGGDGLVGAAMNLTASVAKNVRPGPGHCKHLLRRVGRHPGGDPAHAHPHLRKAPAGRYGKGGRQGRVPHHRGRVLREHPSHDERGPHRKVEKANVPVLPIFET